MIAASLAFACSGRAARLRAAGVLPKKEDMRTNHTRQTQQLTRTRSRVVPAFTGAVILLALIVGAIWWFTGRTTAVDDTRAPAQVDANGVPVERADGLPDDTELGVNELRVREFAEVEAFYRDAVGLTVFEESEGEVLLGLDEEAIIRLVQSDEPLPSPQDAGLYHTAILFPDEASLAETLLRTAQAAPELYQGSADHIVSEAFYFADPEGNGVELYVDRSRSEWKWQDGIVEMGSEPLDPNTFIEEHLPQAGSAAGTPLSATVGHVHLKVGDLERARAFYAEMIGFDVVSEAEGALFYSAGGYHHHLATNIWQSAGAGKRTTEVGLGSVTIALPDDASVAAVAARLDRAGVRYDDVDRGIVAADPWGNRLRLVSPGFAAR